MSAGSVINVHCVLTQVVGVAAVWQVCRCGGGVGGDVSVVGWCECGGMVWFGGLGYSMRVL